MRVRLPTPLHGWRTFWGEVGIIVLAITVTVHLIGNYGNSALCDGASRGGEEGN